MKTQRNKSSCGLGPLIVCAGVSATSIGACGADPSRAEDEDPDDTTHAEPEAESEPIEPEPASTSAESLYNLKCAPCHGANLTGTSEGADLTERLPTLSDEQAFTSIKHGVAPGMPAWESELSDEEIDALIAFLRARVE